MLPRIVKKYLDKHIASLNYSPVKNNGNLYEAVCVIPSLAESENIDALLDSLMHNKSEYIEKTLFLFVVNNIEEAAEDIKQDNYRTLKKLLDYRGSLNIDVIDASSEGNATESKNGGVGLARKIGMDNALLKFNYNGSSRNIIICLDADCTVSHNYLESIFMAFEDRSVKAGYVRFEHTLSGNEEIDRAIINYEIFLRYYLLGLKYAGSPYAFHTIGSTMLCDYESYISIGGMNKKKAGEDFYFMEKLAKNFPITEIKSGVVYPSSRPSLRVPFGTGQRINRFLKHERNEYLVYNHESFLLLKKWIAAFHQSNETDAAILMNKGKEISPLLYEFLRENDFEKSWNKILMNTKTEEQLEKQKRYWFDGFRTLKLIHYLREKGYKDVDTFDGVNSLAKLIGLAPPIGINKSSPISEQIKVLKFLRNID